MNKDKCIEQFLQELGQVFDNIKVEQNNLYIAKGNLDISISISDIKRDFITNGYTDTKKNYIEIIQKVVEEQKTKINLDEVTPILRNKNFLVRNRMEFIKDELGKDMDIEVLYVLDKKSCWKYLTKTDLENCELTIDEVKSAGYGNIRQLTVPLTCMDSDIQVFGLQYDTELGASIFLSAAMQEQIVNKVGKDALLGFPSEGMLLVSKYSYSYLDIMQVLIENEVNEESRLSKKLYRYRDGKLQTVNIKRKLELVK